MFGLFKEWDQSAQNQTKNGKNSGFSNFMEPIVPQGKTVDEKLKFMQSNPLYNDQNDRRLFNHVTEEYKRAYPGTIQHDEFGKMQRPSKPSIQPDQVRAFDPDGVLGKTRQANTGGQVGAKQPALPGVSGKPAMNLAGQNMGFDAGAIPKLGKPIMPPSKKPLQQSVKQPQTNPLMNALTGKQDKDSLGQRKTPMRKPQAEQEIGFGKGRGDFVTGVDAHDEDVNDLIAQTKVPQAMPQKFAEQQQAMEEHQRQNRMQQYDDIAEEGYDMSDADLEGSGIETMDQMIAGGMSKEQYTQQLTAEQSQRRDEQIARSDDLKANAEDIHDVDLHASGEDTMEDIAANAMTRAEYQRHQAALNAQKAKQQVQVGQKALDDAEDIHDQTTQGMIDAHEKGSPLTQEQLRQKAEDATFAQTYRTAIGSGDRAHVEKTMANLDHMKANNPEEYAKIGPDNQKMHEAYNQLYAEEIKNGLSPKEAKQAIFDRFNGFGARNNSAIAFADAARRKVNDAITGVKFYANMPVDQEAYERMNAPTMPRAFANSTDGKVVYRMAETGVNAATAVVSPWVAAPVAFAGAAGKEAYRQDKAGQKRSNQHNAATLRGAANAIGEAIPVPGIGYVLDEATGQWIDYRYGKNG